MFSLNSPPSFRNFVSIFLISTSCNFWLAVSIRFNRTFDFDWCWIFGINSSYFSFEKFSLVKSHTKFVRNGNKETIRFFGTNKQKKTNAIRYNFYLLILSTEIATNNKTSLSFYVDTEKRVALCSKIIYVYICISGFLKEIFFLNSTENKSIEKPDFISSQFIECSTQLHFKPLIFASLRAYIQSIDAIH